MTKQTVGEQHRTIEQLREQYEIEQELANRLRRATKDERLALYTSVYEELFRRVPHHPQVTRKRDPEARRQAALAQMRLLNHFLTPESTFLEIGAGDGCLSFEVARVARQVYALDVSETIAGGEERPKNFQLIISQGTDIPLPDGSVHIAYSRSLVEHLHPEDGLDHFRHVCRVLAPGGIYICDTPNRLNGPHDISVFFDDVPKGLHLKEYTVGELADTLKATGFSKVKEYVEARGLSITLPTGLVRAIESSIAPLSARARRRVAGGFPLGTILGITVIATK